MIKRTGKPLCVLGVMNNYNGTKIAIEMLDWLLKYYDVVQVVHDGKQFELPALQEAKRLSKSWNEPVLYIHTRGAVNVWKTTAPTHRMWKAEFGEQWRKYQLIASADEPVVVCPFVDKDRETRYNGFVANPKAWDMIELAPAADRMVFERLWAKTDCKVIGMLIHSEKNDIERVRKYLYTNYD